MNNLIPFILAFEAGVTMERCPYTSNLLRFQEARKTGYSDDPNDPGGATQCGVTLKTYTAWCAANGEPKPTKQRLRNIPFQHWESILREWFWEKTGGDHIPEPIAWILTDFVWASGPKVLKRVQKILGVKADGIIGPKTTAAINAADPAVLFDSIKVDRLQYIDEIIKVNPKLEIYRKGWTRRIAAITFYRLNY